MRKVAFLGYDFFYSCLDVLKASGAEVSWLFTSDCDNKYNFNKKVLRFAKRNKSIVKFDRIIQSDINQLEEEGCELLISAAYPFKIPISEKIKAINIHPTLLPEGRGPWPLPYTILKQLTHSGTTIHKLTAEFDSGDILLQSRFPITQNENLETLSCKVQIEAAKLLTELLGDLDFYWENARSQGIGSYWPMPTFDERELYWDKSVDEIDLISRSFGKFDSFGKWNNKEWIVQNLSVWKEIHNFTPGKVIHETNKEVVIAAKDGFACIRFFKIDPDF